SGQKRRIHGDHQVELGAGVSESSVDPAQRPASRINVFHHLDAVVAVQLPRSQNHGAATSLAYGLESVLQQGASIELEHSLVAAHACALAPGKDKACDVCVLHHGKPITSRKKCLTPFGVKSES